MSENRYSSAISALAMLVLLTLVGLGAGAMLSTDLAKWTRPRIGTNWIMLIFPLLYLLQGVFTKCGLSYIMAAMMCFLFAVHNTIHLRSIGTVATVTNYLDDQLPTAWYWQVAALNVVGLMLAGQWFFITDLKRFWGQPSLNLMRDSSHSAGPSNWKRIKESPQVIQLFILYGTCSTFIEFVSLIFGSTRTTFSIVAAFIYVAPLFIMYNLFLSGPKKTNRRMLFLASSLLAALGVQLIAVWVLQRELDTGSVATRIRIIAPFFWAVMFWSPMMLRLIATDRNAEIQSAHASIGDLVFLTSIAAIAIAVSLAPFWGT